MNTQIPSITEGSPFLGDGCEGETGGERNVTSDDRDSGIQHDGEFLDHTSTGVNKQGYVHTADDVDDIVQQWSRRSSIVSRSSVAVEPTDPSDERCGWGPLSPQCCHQFRNPKWVVLWLSLAGVCQVRSLLSCIFIADHGL